MEALVCWAGESLCEGALLIWHPGVWVEELFLGILFCDASRKGGAQRGGRREPSPYLNSVKSYRFKNKNKTPKPTKRTKTIAALWQNRPSSFKIGY